MSRNSDNSKSHAYLKHDFFLRPENMFWETPHYSQEAKEHYRKLNAERAKRLERNLK